MAACGRRSKPRLLLGLFGVTLVGYLIFSRQGDVSGPARRPEPGLQPEDTDNDDLKKPVYDKPPAEPGSLGEMGRAVKLSLTGEEKLKEEESIKKHQINTYVSDRVSLHRRLPERWNPL